MRNFTPNRIPALFGLAFGVAGAMALSPGAHAATVTSLFSTGVTSAGTLSPTSTTTGSTPVSVADVHYQVRDASVANSTFGAAYVSDPSQYPISTGNWTANTSKSQWISPNANPGANFPSDNYDYRTTFDLSGFNPNTFALNINLAADNYADILLNGTALKTTQGGFNSFTALTFNAGSDVTFRNALVSGVNTLDFLVHNTGGPTGLQAQVSGTANVPEPGSVALLVGMSVSGAGFFLRRRKK